jgi:carboxylesterase
VSGRHLHNPDLDGDTLSLVGGTTGALLFHGFTATTAEIRPLAAAFHDAGLTVVAPLLPGHGTRPEDLNAVHWQDWTAAAEASYRDLAARCERVVVGGESMGAVIALGLAAKHPEIAAVLCFAPAIKLDMSRFDVFKLRATAPFVTQVARAHLDGAEEWQGYPGLPLRGAVQLLRLQKATLPALAAVHQPVAIFQGRNDTTIDPRAGDIIRAAVSSDVVEQYWMEHSSHSVTLDAERDDIARLSLEFLSRNSRA